MKNYEINELNEKVKNELKKDNEENSDEFDDHFPIFVLFSIFGGIALAYICNYNNIDLPRIIFRALGFDVY